MIPTVIKCDKCDFSEGDMFWGDYVYDAGEQMVPIPRRTGWCHSCNSIATVEDLPRLSLRDIPKEAPEVKLFRELTENDRKPDTWFSRLFKSKKAAERQTVAREESRRAEEREELFNSIVRMRNGKNRCLRCGSNLVEHFDEQQDSGKSSDNWPRFNHPMCGGNLYTKTLRSHMYVGYIQRIYSPDGDFLCEKALRPRQLRTE